MMAHFDGFESGKVYPFLEVMARLDFDGPDQKKARRSCQTFIRRSFERAGMKSPSNWRILSGKALVRAFNGDEETTEDGTE